MKPMSQVNPYPEFAAIRIYVGHAPASVDEADPEKELATIYVHESQLLRPAEPSHEAPNELH